MDRKQLQAGRLLKATDQGVVEAVFARLNVIDHDGDVTVPGAFTNGERVKISAFNHGSWANGLPVGKGTIREEGDLAILDGQFFLNTTHGRDTFEVVKELGVDGEWSYGFDVLDSGPGEFDGQQVRVLRKMKVHEVSPVLLGAGIDTHTRAAKGRHDRLSAADEAAVDRLLSGREVAKTAERLLVARNAPPAPRPRDLDAELARLLSNDEKRRGPATRSTTVKTQTAPVGARILKSGAIPRDHLGVLDPTRKGSTATIDIDPETDLGLKAMTRTDDPFRTSETVPAVPAWGAQNPPEMLEVIRLVPVDTPYTSYVEEDIVVNPAAEVAEGAAYPEATINTTPRIERLRKVGLWIPTPDELFEDEPSAERYLSDRLPFLARERLAGQILVGNGVGSNLTGIANTSGVLVGPSWSAAATNADQDSIEAVVAAATQARTSGRARPNAVAVSEGIWDLWVDAKDGNRNYLTGLLQWIGQNLYVAGMRVVMNTSLTDDTQVVGDFANHARVTVRREADIELSQVHATFMAENKTAVRVTLKAWLEVLRPAAFAVVSRTA